MAILTLKNYNKHFSDDQKLMAAKCQIRECDEETKGNFVGFVDLAKESFDVNVSINTKGEIVSKSCECGKTDCAHIFALIKFLDSGQKVTELKIPKKKRSNIELLLDKIDTEDLKVWVIESLNSNKIIETEFLLKFSPKSNTYFTEKEIKDLTKNGIKAVLGTVRKKIEKKELQLIIATWKKLHKPIFDNFVSNPSKIESLIIAVLSYDEFMETCKCPSYASWYTYSESIDKTLLEIILGIQDENEFNKVIFEITNYIYTDTGKISVRILNLSKTILANSSIERKRNVFRQVNDFFQKIKTLSVYHYNILNIELFEMVNNADLFENYYHQFKLSETDVSYNLSLIQKLIEHNKIELAESFCNAEIRSNYYEIYKPYYYQKLKIIYQITGNQQKLLETKKILLPHFFNFDDYLSIIETISENNKVEFRTHIQKIAKKKSRGEYLPKVFLVKLAHYENRGKQLLSYLTDFKELHPFLDCIHQMINAEPLDVLNILVTRFTSIPWGHSKETIKREKEVYPIVMDYLKQAIDFETIAKIYRQKCNNYWLPESDSFARYIFQEIGN